MSLFRMTPQVRKAFLLAAFILSGQAQALSCHDWSDELAFQTQKIREANGRLAQLRPQAEAANKSKMHFAERKAASLARLNQLTANYNLASNLIAGIDRAYVEIEKDDLTRQKLAAYLLERQGRLRASDLDTLDVPMTFANVVRMVLLGYEGFSGEHSETVHESWRGFYAALTAKESCSVGFGMKMAREAMTEALALLIRDIPDAEQVAQADTDAFKRYTDTATQLAAQIQEGEAGLATRSDIVNQAQNLGISCARIREASIVERRMPR